MTKEHRLFPHALIRSSNQGTKVFMESFMVDEHLRLMGDFLLIIKREQEQKKRLTDVLKEYMLESSNGHIQNQFQNIRRNVFNGRKIKEKHFLEVKHLLTDETIALITSYKSGEVREEIDDLEKVFNRYKNQINDNIKDLLSDDFLNALILSDTRLVESVTHGDYRLKSKKGRKVRITLAKYLSRMFTKTSPFSTFTKISLGNLSDGIAINSGRSRDRSIITLNNFLLGHLQKLLLTHEPFFLKMKIELNHTIRFEDGFVRFITSVNNRERIQKITLSKPISLFINSIEEQSGEISLHTLIELISKKANQKDTGSARKMILSLYEAGVISVRWNFDKSDANWILKLADLIFQLNDEGNETLNELINSLRKVNDLVSNYADKPPNERQDCLFEVIDLLKSITSSFENGDEYIKNNFEGSRRILYEDCINRSEYTLDEKGIGSVVGKLDELLSSLKLFDNRSDNNALLKHIFNQKHRNEQEVPLDVFSETYFRYLQENSFKEENKKEFINNLEIDSIQLRNQKRTKWINEFKKKLPIESDNIDLTQEVLEELNSKYSNNKEKEVSSFGALIQFSNVKDLSEGSYSQVIVNGVFSGYGKFSSRFLPFLDQKVTSEQREFNKQHSSHGELLVENNDASIFNANNRPSLLPYKIQIPGEYLKEEDYSQALNLKNFVIRNSNELELIYKPLNKRAYVLDLDLQDRSQRSPMFQLLEYFSKAEYPMINVLKELIVKHYVPGIDDISRSTKEIKVIPRLTYEKKIVLSRKTWLIPKALIPEKLVGMTDFEYFILLNDWRNSNSIPDEVYIHRKNKGLTEKKVVNDGSFKPQYIHFGNQYLIEVFESELRKSTGFLTIVEALPIPKNYELFDEEKTCVEYLVQWNSL